MANYLVTGAAGFIGSHLSRTLLEQGHSVKAIDALTDYYPAELKRENLGWIAERGEFDLYEEDLSTADLEKLLVGVDGVFHLAAQPGIRASWGSEFEIYLRDNVLATQRVFEAVSGSRLRVVYASSSSVYGDAEAYPTAERVVPAPISPYGITKLACEHLARSFARAHGLNAVGLRYFTVYGPRQRPDMAFTRLVSAAIRGEPFVLLGDGSQSRDFTYVDDAVSATIAAMKVGRAGRIYNVGGGSEVSLREIIDAVGRLAGRPVPLIQRPRSAGDVKRTASDPTLVRAELDWQPWVQLSEGLQQHFEWAQEALVSAGPHG